MGGDVDDAQPRRHEHHRYFRRAGQMRQQFGVPGKAMASGMQRLLVDRRSADRLHSFSTRQFDCFRYELVRRLASDAGKLAERKVLGHDAEVNAVDDPGLELRLLGAGNAAHCDP